MDDGNLYSIGGYNPDYWEVPNDADTCYPLFKEVSNNLPIYGLYRIRLVKILALLLFSQFRRKFNTSIQKYHIARTVSMRYWIILLWKLLSDQKIAVSHSYILTLHTDLKNTIIYLLS